MTTPADLFRHCPRCGAAHPGPHGAIPFQCAACSLTLFLNPTVAAAAFVFDADGRALFIRRAHAPSQGKLGIPGGFVDFGESGEVALRREVREEVGLEIGEPTYLCSFPNRYEYRGVVYGVCDLIFTALAIDPHRAEALDAVAGLEWRIAAEVDPEELAFPSLRAGWEYLTRKG